MAKLGCTITGIDITSRSWGGLLTEIRFAIKEVHGIFTVMWKAIPKIDSIQVER
jgi:hypothetical protein